MEEYIHLATLGIACEKLGESKLKNPKSTLRPNAVTCPKCIEILKNIRVLK